MADVIFLDANLAGTTGHELPMVWAAAFFLLLLIGSVFLSCARSAMTAASRTRMQTLASEGDARARLVNRLREDRDTLTGSLLLAHQVVNIFTVVLITVMGLRLFGGLGGVYAAAMACAVVLVLIEGIPKAVSLLDPDRMALALASSVNMVVRICAPVYRGVGFVVQTLCRVAGVKTGSHGHGDLYAEELRGAIELVGSDVSPDAREEEEEEQAVAQETKAMLRSILDLADVQVAEIMVHRRDVRTTDISQPIVKIVDAVLQSAYTRLPVWEGGSDNIVGILHAKLLLQEIRRCQGDMTRVSIRNAMLAPWFIPESTTLFDQLQAFRSRREHFAVVVDEYGVLRGVVTLEDILEEIVGQIDDEYDVAASGVRLQPDGSYIVDGKVTIRDLNRDLAWKLPDEDYATLAGLLLFESQRIPMVGQSYSFFDFRFEVLKRQRNQITQVRVTLPGAVS